MPDQVRHDMRTYDSRVKLFRVNFRDNPMAPRADQAAPPLEAEQAPDQQPMVHPPRDVVCEGPLDISPPDELQQQAVPGEQRLSDIIHQIDPVPGLVRGAEPLLAFFQDQLGYITSIVYAVIQISI